MLTIILLLWSLFLPWLLGFALISLFNKHTKSLPFYQKISLSFLLGTGIFTMSLFIASLMGFGWNREWISIIFGLPSAIILCKIYLKKWRYKSDDIRKITAGLNVVNILLLCIILFKLFSIFYLA